MQTTGGHYFSGGGINIQFSLVLFRLNRFVFLHIRLHSVIFLAFMSCPLALAGAGPGFSNRGGAKYYVHAEHFPSVKHKVSLITAGCPDLG